MESYEVAKDNCELLKEIVKESIQDGNHYIDIEKIPYEKVTFKISMDKKDKNIIFHCWIETGAKSPFGTYTVTVTLSEDYELLKEEYDEIMSFDEYNKHQKDVVRLCSFLISLFIIVLFIGATLLIISKIFEVCEKIKEKKG